MDFKLPDLASCSVSTSSSTDAPFGTKTLTRPDARSPPALQHLSLRFLQASSAAVTTITHVVEACGREVTGTIMTKAAGDVPPPYNLTIRLILEGPTSVITNLLRLIGSPSESSCGTATGTPYQVELQKLVSLEERFFDEFTANNNVTTPMMSSHQIQVQVGRQYNPVAPNRLVAMTPATSPSQYRKLRTLHGNDNKYVFLVMDPNTKETMVMKEQTSVPAGGEVQVRRAKSRRARARTAG